MAQSGTADKKFAILIDADNIGSKYIKIILDEISKEGTATYKRIYGDWTSPMLAPWKQILLEHSVTPMQQYSYTTGKNSTDSAMIIDAMDILYSGKVDGFCIASSDSDFTRLASRLRESGMTVIGMGEQKTPRPFVSACDRFSYIDNLLKSQIGAQTQKKSSAIGSEKEKTDKNEKNDKNDRTVKTPKAVKAERQDSKAADKIEKIEKNDKNDKIDRKPKNQPTGKTAIARAHEAALPQVSLTPTDAVDILVADVANDDITSVTDIDTIKDAISAIVEDLTSDDEDGWILLSDVGNVLRKRYPDFDQRNYGYSKMTTFIAGLDLFEIKKVVEDPQNPKSAVIFIRNKNNI